MVGVQAFDQQDAVVTDPAEWKLLAYRDEVNVELQRSDNVTLCHSAAPFAEHQDLSTAARKAWLGDTLHTALQHVPCPARHAHAAKPCALWCVSGTSKRLLTQGSTAVA
jgi:hypothetical protein